MPLSILIALAISLRTSKMSDKEYAEFGGAVDYAVIVLLKILIFGFFLGIVLPWMLFTAYTPEAVNFGYWYTPLYWIIILLLYVNDKLKEKEKEKEKENKNIEEREN